MATDPVIPWSPAPTIPGSVRTPGGGLIAPSAPRLYSPFSPQIQAPATGTRRSVAPTSRTGAPKLKKPSDRNISAKDKLARDFMEGKTDDGGNWQKLLFFGTGKAIDRETEEIGRMLSNAGPAMVTFVGGLAADLKGLSYNKLIRGQDYDANTAQELWHSLGRTGGLLYDAKPGRGAFARWKDYWDAAESGQAISSLLIEDAGNMTLTGAGLAKAAGTVGKVARVGAEGRAMVAGAPSVGAAETGLVSEAAKAAAPRLSRIAEAGMKTEAGIRKAIKPVDYLLSLPIKPYVYATGKLGSIVRNGAYFGSLHTGWGRKAADAYIQELRDLQASPNFDPTTMQYEVSRLQQKISRHQKLAMSWQARREAVAAARRAEEEAGRQARAVITAVENAPHANQVDPVTNVQYGDQLSPDEQSAVIAAINGTAHLVDGMVNEFGESVENIVTLSRFNDQPGFSPTPNGIDMAVRFLKPGGGGLSPMQYDRIAKTVEAVVKSLRFQAVQKAGGVGRRYPLQPHNFVPVPVVQYLLEAVKREAAATRDPYLIQAAEFIQNNQGLWDLPVDNPVRIQMLQFLIKNMPASILYDSSIYPSAMRPLVEMYKRYRRNLERRAIAAGEGGDMPMGPRAGKPGAAGRYVAQARLRASEAKAKIDKLSERIARLEEQHSRGVDTLRRMEMVERIANGESLESIAAEYGVRPEDLQKIYTGSKVGQTRRRYEEARDAARALLQQAIDAGVVRIENGAMVYTTRNELTAQLEAAVADAQALNQEYRDLIESITQEKVAAARELEDLADEIDDTSEEMFDAEDDFVADGGDITELEQPDTSLEELRGETPEAVLAREAVSLRDEVEASLTTDEISREVDALRKKVAFLEERAAGAESAPRGDFVPRQPTADDVVAAVDELLKAGKITEANAEKIKYDLQPHGYKPYASSAERSRNIDNEAFSESKSVNGIEVENIDGDLWWTDGYVIARVSDTPILNSKNNPVAAPGRYRANSGNKQTTIKSEGYTREGDVVRNMKGLVETFPKDSEMIVAVPDETYVSWIKTGKGETARTEVVFIRAADGTYLTADADFIRMFDDGNTAFYIPQNVNKGKLNIIVAKRNGKTVGYIASIRVGDAMSAPPPIEKIVADNASVSPDLIGLGDELLKKLGLMDPRAGISVQGSTVVASKDLKQARERLKRFEDLLESRTKAEAKLKPVKRAPEKEVEPTGYTIDAEELFDPYDGWEQYYAQEDLSIPIDEFSSLVNEKRFALAIHGDLKSVELAISDPEQYGASVDQSLINDILRGRKKDSALKSIREDINGAIATIAELESAIRDAIEPYEAARGRGRLAPPEQPAARPAKKPAKLTAAQKKSPAAGMVEQARRVQEDFFETYKTGESVKGMAYGTFPSTIGPNIYVTRDGKRIGILVSEKPGKKSPTGAVTISLYIDDNANIADVVSVFNRLEQQAYNVINDFNNGRLVDRDGKPYDYSGGPIKDTPNVVGNSMVYRGSKPFDMKAINQAINAYRQALLAGQEAITTGTRTAAVEPPSARLVQPEAAPSALSPESDLRARLADVEARMEAYMDSNEYYSNKGIVTKYAMEAEAASIRRQIEQISQPVAESDVVFFREEYGGVPGFWKRGNVEWYTRSEAADQGVAAGYYTPKNVNKGDIEPDRLADDTLSDMAEKNPDAGLFIKIDKAPKGFVAGADPAIQIAVPPTWQELRTMIDSVVDYLDGGREGKLADNLRKSVSVRAIYGTNDYKKLIPELKRLRKYIDGKIAEGETTIYTPRAADTTQRITEPQVTPTARPTNLRSVTAAPETLGAPATGGALFDQVANVFDNNLISAGKTIMSGRNTNTMTIGDFEIMSGTKPGSRIQFSLVVDDPLINKIVLLNAIDKVMQDVVGFYDQAAKRSGSEGYGSARIDLFDLISEEQAAALDQRGVKDYEHPVAYIGVFNNGKFKTTVSLPEFKAALQSLRDRIISIRDTPAALVTPENVAVARPTNLRSVPVKQLPAAHAEIADPSPGFTVEILGPYRYGGGTTTGGIEFATSNDSVLNRFGYELFDGSTFESAVKALDVIIKETQKYIDRGDYIPLLALGLFDTTTGNKFYAQLALDGSTPDGLDAVYAILDEAQRQRDILTGKAAEQPTRPAEVRPRPEIVDRDIQSQVFADDAVRAIAPRLAAKVDAAQTVSEKIQALDELMNAVAKSQERWTEYQEALARNEKRRQGILSIPGRISTAEKAREQAEAVMQEQIAKAVAVETSPEYQRLTSMPATLPLDIAMDPTRQGLTQAGFGEIQLPDGSTVRATGPIYVPSRGDFDTTGLKRTYTAREGLPGFIPDISERMRRGDREMIWNLAAVAARIKDTASRMTLNESWRMFIGQHGKTLEEMIKIVNDRIEAANARDGGSRLLYDLEAMRQLAYQQALNMPVLERQERYAPETLPEGVTPETFVPGVGAMAPGVASPETNLQRMANRQLGKMIMDIMDAEHFAAVNPWGRARQRYNDFELVNPEMMFMDRTTLDISTTLSSELNPDVDGLVVSALTRVNKFFKASTLALSLMWQIGDLTTSLIIAQLTGVNVKTMIRRMKEVYEAEYGTLGSMFDINAPDIPKTPLAELAMSSGVQDVSASMSERQFLRGYKVSPRGRFLERGTLGKIGGAKVQRLADRSFKFNETINRISRHAFFLEKLENLLREKGRTLDNVVDDGSWRYDSEIRAAVEDAAATANKWLGDFGDLSIREKKYVSLAIPFWAWIKHIHKVFYALGRDHPESLKWYIYMGTLGSDLENDPLDLRLGTVASLGGVASVNFLNPLADVFEGPFVRLARGEAEGLGRAAGPIPRIAGAVLGIDIGRMQRLSRPAGTGMYSKTGMPQAGLGNIFDPSTWSQVAGYGLQQFPIATRLAAFGPVGETLPGTTLALGPVSRYSTGEARRRGSGEIITQPGIPLPGGGESLRLAALGRLFSVPFIPSRSEKQINDVLKSAERRLKSVERAKKRAEQGG